MEVNRNHHTTARSPAEGTIPLPHPAHGDRPYLPGLDGLRALAVVAVIAYHLGWLPGGFLGVQVFFVLSGYLITDLLATQWEDHGRIDFRQFWLRRARRLLPALWAMLLGVTCWVTLLDRSALATMRSDILAALLYASNWWYIFHHVAYFKRFGPPSPLNHLWSLAVEEQFYLLWPLLLALGLRRIRLRWLLVAATLVAAGASALAMALLFHAGHNPDRVYYGTDTRAFALLIGAAVALLWPSRRIAATRRPRLRRWADVAGALGIAAVIAGFVLTNPYQSALYRGGMAALAVATAAVIVALAQPHGLLGRLLGSPVPRWIGVRSYAIYLWHYPVIALTTPLVPTASWHIPRDLAQVAVSIALAALSWRFVEDPIRHGALQRLWHRAQAGLRQLGAATWAASTGVLLAVGVSVVGVAGILPTASASTAIAAVSPPPLGITVSVPPPPTSSVPSASQERSASTASSTAVGSTSGASSTTASSSSVGATLPAGALASGIGVTAIGDSILIDAQPYLQRLLPGIVVDGSVGRQLYQAPAVITRLKASGQLGCRVIIELGTNGPYPAPQLLALLRSLGPVQRIVLVNTRVPQPWQDVVNATIAAVAASYPHATLADWYAASAGQTQFFWSDGVHLDPAGAAFYANLLAQALFPEPAAAAACPAPAAGS